MLKELAKSVVRVIALLAATPAALLTRFGRSEIAFQFFAQAVALIPGMPGDYLRAAYYTLTLKQFSMTSRISFGSIIAQSATSIGPGVYVGAYCVIGASTIGERTQIASHVQIMGGARQHVRNSSGNISGCEPHMLNPISIGSDCWLGAGSLVMADVGNRSTIGAGSVVTSPIGADTVAFGNPAIARGQVVS
jgi:acetyltransferase-like isoleucine patch superfamily enzyme